MDIEYLSSLFDENLSISDDAYAEQLQFQEILEASSFLSSRHYDGASTSSQILCEICTEERDKSDMFRVEGCPHSFCSICVSKHVEYKLKEGIIFISCPHCANIMDPPSVRSIVPADVVDRWEEAIAESTILPSQKVHCPYEDCSEILLNDSDEGVDFTESECPRCNRLLCAKCKVPWHEGLDCKEFQRSNICKKEKQKLSLLARENKWKKCPNCKVFVDKTEGCIHITCRCKFEFCYICGSSWNENHWNTCQPQE